MVTCTTPPFRAAVRLNSGVSWGQKWVQACEFSGEISHASVDAWEARNKSSRKSGLPARTKRESWDDSGCNRTKSAQRLVSQLTSRSSRARFAVSDRPTRKGRAGLTQALGGARSSSSTRCWGNPAPARLAALIGHILRAAWKQLHSVCGQTFPRTARGRTEPVLCSCPGLSVLLCTVGSPKARWSAA